MLASKGRIPLF